MSPSLPGTSPENLRLGLDPHRPYQDSKIFEEQGGPDHGEGKEADGKKSVLAEFAGAHAISRGGRGERLPGSGPGKITWIGKTPGTIPSFREVLGKTSEEDHEED
jgi:hypothetical protein